MYVHVHVYVHKIKGLYREISPDYCYPNHNNYSGTPHKGYSTMYMYMYMNLSNEDPSLKRMQLQSSKLTKIVHLVRMQLQSPKFMHFSPEKRIPLSIRHFTFSRTFHCILKIFFAYVIRTRTCK